MYLDHGYWISTSSILHSIQPFCNLDKYRNSRTISTTLPLPPTHKLYTLSVWGNYIFSILVQTKVVAEWSVHGSSSTYELNGCDTQKFPVWRTGIYNKLRLNLLNGLLSLNKHDTLEKATNVELALPNMRILLKWISEDAEHLRISNFPPHVYMVWYVLSIAFLCNSCNFRYLILG